MTDAPLTPLCKQFDDLCRKQHSNLLLAYNMALLKARSDDERGELLTLYLNAGCMAISTAITSTGDGRHDTLEDVLASLPEAIRAQVTILGKKVDEGGSIPLSRVGGLQ